MPDIHDGETVEVQGSAKDPYILKNTGGVYSCSCPAWRTQSHPIEKRTCKHLRKYRGEAAELERLGGELPAKAATPKRKSPSKIAASGSISAGTADGVTMEEVIPGLLLAHSWDNSTDLSGWWMSEKLDGVRAYWDGKQFISRQGNVFLAPDWFTEDLPNNVHLDGELWIARKAFQRTVSIVRRQDRGKEWEEVKYLVFDAPQVDDFFEARVAYLQKLLDATQPGFATAHKQERCRNVEHLLDELKRVEAAGGEGLMLRQPSSRYEFGRSHSLLKVKTFHDAEAKVLEYLPGTGKHKGRMGALSVELANGVKFAIGTGFSDKERANPPPIGSIVTFRYQELTDAGVPRFPSYVRARTDVDVLPNEVMGDRTASVSADSGAAKVSDKDEDKDKNKHVGGENVLSFTPRSGASVTESAAESDSVNDVAEREEISSIAVAGNDIEMLRPNILGAHSCYCSECYPPLAGDSRRKSSVATEPKLVALKTVGTESGVRYFEFVEGSSSKFWSIKMSGNDVTVKYGRIGTNGQEKTKSFPNSSAAKKYYDEIVDEKVGKGYEEK